MTPSDTIDSEQIPNKKVYSFTKLTVILSTIVFTPFFLLKPEEAIDFFPLLVFYWFLYLSKNRNEKKPIC
jgi:hypothetical protein